MNIDENSLSSGANRKIAKVTNVLCLALISVLITASCSKFDTNELSAEREHSLQIRFRLHYGDQEIGCDSQFMQTLQSGSEAKRAPQKEAKRAPQREWQIDRLGFYISEIYLGHKDKKHKLKLSPSNWQSDTVGLIWFPENCQESAQSNQVLRLHDLEKWRHADSLEFTLGVPFAENHMNPLLQASPLNLPEMFWSWRNGHKFLRLDIASAGIPKADMSNAANEQWSFHLGSVACSSVSSLRPPDKPCQQPNRILFKLDISKAKQTIEDGITPSIEIAFDLAQLLSDVILEQDKRCMFDYSQQSQCAVLINNLESGHAFRAAGVESKSL